MSEEKEKKRDEALVERLMRRVLEGMGSVVDRKLGREADAQTGFTTTKLIERMKHLVDERTRAPAESPVMRALREGAPVAMGARTLLVSSDGVERPIEDSSSGRPLSPS